MDEGFLSGGETADVSGWPELTKDIIVYTVPAEMGYDSDKFRREPRSNNNVPVISGRKNGKEEIEYARQ